ncbi:hypothetical protein BWI17_13510 [Betaproteobacteria bacterium GR16-43]|nr:hypothetical protein BWI17_13510 [Betaproteobacteria bacterium GR16-43]
MKPLLRPLAVALAATIPALADAATSLTIYSSARPGTLDPQTFKSGGEGTAVPGYALVREERPFVLKSGRNILRITDVPALIDPTTVSFASLTDPKGTSVVEQSFEFDLTSPQKLMSRYLDREVTLEQVRGQSVESITGTLIGTQGGVTLRNPDGSLRVVHGYSGVRLPSLPGGLISKPTLAWDLDAATAGTHQSRFTYQTGGMTWWTDYNLTYTETSAGNCKVDVGAWVTIVNQSGASFSDAKLKLIAGDVQRAQPPAARPAAVGAMALESRVARKDEGFQEKAFFEYHLYTLGRPTSLAQNSMKQIELFPMAAGVGCEKKLVYFGQGYAYPYYGSPMVDRAYGATGNKKVDVYLRVKNAKANNLGVPLPAGKVRVSKLDEADQSLEFIGEDLIDHTARDETVQIKLGSAFDVVGERKQVDFRINTDAKWMEEDIEVRVRNQKPDASETVLVRESLYRWSNWTILRKTHEFTKEDSRTLHFPVKIGPKGEAVVRYTVRYTW